MARLTLLLCLLALPAWAGELWVVDGDTLELNGERIQLYGIDAPELGQNCTKGGLIYNCGLGAASALVMLTNGGVTCDSRGKDKDGRTLAVCYSGDRDLNVAMVRRGLALADRRYSSDYIAQEEEARAAERGMWAGEFMAPWEWRKANR